MIAKEIPILVIFIDAMPFYEGASLAERLNAKSYKKVTPGIGYSINVKTEIFAGIGPDEVGYFCEWVFKKEKQYSNSICLMFKFFNYFSNFNTTTNKVLHRITGKIIRTLQGHNHFISSLVID